jgi:SAM-dependent methyltransferase
VTTARSDRGHRIFAAFYDWATTRRESGRPDERRERLVGDLVGNVLEVGIGNGLNLGYYRRLTSLTAVEPDRFMRRQLERRAAAATFPFEVIAGEAEALPFPAGSFDAVVTSLVLCSVRDPAQALSEIGRVLKPGREYRFLEHVRGEGLGGMALDVVRPIWSFAAGGCQPNRRTEATIRLTGLSIVSLERYREGLLPHILGIAVSPANAVPSNSTRES